MEGPPIRDSEVEKLAGDVNDLSTWLSGLVRRIPGCLRTACGCYVAYLVVLLVGFVVWAVLDSVFGR